MQHNFRILLHLNCAISCWTFLQSTTRKRVKCLISFKAVYVKNRRQNNLRRDLIMMRRTYNNYFSFISLYGQNGCVSRCITCKQILVRNPQIFQQKPEFGHLLNIKCNHCHLDSETCIYIISYSIIGFP